MKSISKEQAENAHNKNQKSFTKNDVNKVIRSEDSLKSKFKANKLKELSKDFLMLFSMLKDYASGHYKNVPWSTIASIGGALVYVLSIIDLIPDFIPVLGFMDDAAVFRICLEFIREDLEKYKAWKIENK